MPISAKPYPKFNAPSFGLYFAIAGSGITRSTLSASYVNLGRIKIKRAGSYRIVFGLRSGSAGTTVYGRIYKNSSPYGTERYHNGEDVVYFYETLNFQVGDELQIWGHSDGSVLCFIHDFYILGYPDYFEVLY